MFKNLAKNRDLLFSLVARDIKGRYIGSTLGILWNVITPILQLAIYTVVFSSIMKVKPGPEEGTSSFVAFLFCGLIPWNAFAETVQRSGGVVIENASLIKKIKFPTEVLVVYLAISSFIHQLIALSFFFVLLLVLGQFPHLRLLLLPAVFVVQFFLTVGLAMFVSAINVYVRDVSHIMGLVMMVWFFGTPIVYPLSLVPERLRVVMQLNPMTGLVTLYRNLFLSSSNLDIRMMAALLVSSAVFFLVGYTVFMRHKDEFVDLI